MTVLYRGQQTISTLGDNQAGNINLEGSSNNDLDEAGADIGAKLDRPIVLVGMMGSGKTSVGRRLARVLNWPFQDADWAIETAAGTTIANVFAEIGEDAFRQSERQVIARLLDEQDRQVLALGGGSFVDDQTRILIRECAISVWLSADIEVLVRRTSRRDDRPLLRNGDPREILTRLLKDRRPTYEEADIVVDSGTGTLRDVIDRSLQALDCYLKRGIAT